MTTVSGVSSTTSSYTNIVSANATMNLMLTSNDLANTITSMYPGNTPASVGQAAAALWKLVDVNNASSITLADLQNAVQAQGGLVSNAYALWTQINPGGSYTLNAMQFETSAYVQSSVNTNLTAIQQNVSKALLTQSTSIAATASKTIKTLLTSDNMTNMLAMQSTTDAPPTAQQTASTLWTVINPNDNQTITLADVAKAVTSAGGKTRDAYALWTQINPGAASTMTEKQFTNSVFLKDSVGQNLVTVKKNVADVLATNPFTAEKTVQMLMNSTSVLQALASQSTRWTPPTAAQVFSTLWAVFNVNGTKTISKSDVLAGVNAEGGTPQQAEALWAKLDPNNNGAVGATQFVNNGFLADAIQVSLAKTQTNVGNAQLINSGQSNTVLDAFAKGGTDVLSQAATGYGNSAIGTGNNTNYLNLFV